ncbi:MAG: DsrE family protein [Desulfarculaceae bacterium]|nr:DsrE family protein [Desulfarculaceae bacterium]MCF8072469.1 DsrE family protein [Desulfarculaceae bacterium]MCF8102930.1 DsrE family protein [Desulfarculaceae bacterium]MCF8117467.1 DsrE family protein [Desulfarculaceae bacterium]
MSSDKDTVVIIWSSRDREVAKNMVFMYAKNSRLKGWWPKVRLVVWGPSAALIAEDAELQAELEEARQAGVELLACRACADRYGVAERLESLGIEVIYMGQPLTEYLQSGLPVLTF